jgi:hypothetical protein
MYLVSICTYLNVFLYVLCQYMQVLHVFACHCINATNTFSCLEYVQIRAIHANTDQNTCIYVHQICTNISDCICILKIRIFHVYDSICMYMTVYACISLQQVAGVIGKVCVLSVFVGICMFIHVS